MNTKNNKSKQNSKSKIGNAFMELVQQNDIKDITVTAICAQANINRSTFYASYVDIYDLINKIGEKAFMDFKELHKDDDEFEYLIKLLKYIKKNRLFYKTYIKLRTNNYFDSSVFQGLNDFNTDDTFYNAYHRAGVSKVINLWIDNDCNIPPEELYNTIKRLRS